MMPNPFLVPQQAFLHLSLSYTERLLEAQRELLEISRDAALENLRSACAIDTLPVLQDYLQDQPERLSDLIQQAQERLRRMTEIHSGFLSDCAQLGLAGLPRLAGVGRQAAAEAA